MLSPACDRRPSWLACIFCFSSVAMVACGNSSRPTASVQQPSASQAPDGGVGGSGATDGGPSGGSDGGSGAVAPPTTAPTGSAAPPAAPTPAPPAAPTPAPPLHHRCGWIGGDTADTGAATFAANPDFFDAVHPVWFNANADGSVTPNTHADDNRIVTVARAHHVLLMPLVYGGDDGSIVRSIMSSPGSISAHVDALVNIVMTRGYDGLEIDYEHLWLASDRPTFVALVTQLATALHGKGKQVSLAVSPQTYDDGNSAYDYAGLVHGGADVLHLMGYDFHSMSSDHTGPLAPLGWIDAVGARAASLGIASNVIMGLANYGVGHGWYVSSIAGSIAACGGSYASTTTHMQSCPYGSWTAGTAPHCTTANGDLWFEDSTSIGEKARSAASHGLRGITWYTLGSEPAGFFDAVKSGYPN
jgi:spore germination protein YaaH